jgi:hypothetical protein
MLAIDQLLSVIQPAYGQPTGVPIQVNPGAYIAIQEYIPGRP